jgi:hypothetical protein
MLEEAVERSRPRTVADRLRANSGWFVQAALATSLAWVLAQTLFGHERPIFAPVAALIGVSAWLGQRRRAAIEMLIGIALGIGIADVLVSLIGTGPLQIAAVVTLAMVAAVALGGSTALVSEAAASALLVVTIQLPGSGLSGVRFLDSLLGGVVALAVTSLLPRSPVVSMRRVVAPLLEELAAVLEEVARALERRDADVAERALARAARSTPIHCRTRSRRAGRCCSSRRSGAGRARTSRATRARRSRSTPPSRASRRSRARRCGRSTSATTCRRPCRTRRASSPRPSARSTTTSRTPPASRW